MGSCKSRRWPPSPSDLLWPPGHAWAPAAADGGRFAPELELQDRRRPKGAIGPGQRHHDARRTAGEFSGLVKIGRGRFECSRARSEPLLETQRFAAVLVIGVHPREL